MKKVMIGILFLIPIIILLLVAMVSGIVSTAAHIAVESVTCTTKSGEESLILNLSELDESIINLYDYLNVEVLPTQATDKTVQWTVTDLQYLDEDYENNYKAYKEGLISEIVYPAAMLVDEQNNEVDENTTGTIAINTYCQFTIVVSAENYSDRVLCSVVGYDVETINILDTTSATTSTLVVGEGIRLTCNFTPVDSIVSNVDWFSTNEAVAVVDKNGVIKAVGQGSAEIFAKAHKYSDSSAIVESSKYKINVNKAASLYGNTLYTHLSGLTLTELGIDSSDVVSSTGCTISGDDIAIAGESASIVTANGTLTITKCNEDAIVIDNDSFLNKDSGYVLEVGNGSLQLHAKWMSQTKNDAMSIVWTSSDANIAKVEDGKVTALSSGLVTITATQGGKSASIVLNVQKKVTSMQLTTSNSSMKIGLALETVFASDKYVNVDINNAKVANSTLIRVKGEPTNEDELEEFYSAYKFEIVEGKDFAHFDNLVANKLVFDSEGLKGKERQVVKVKVSAKYPKYETKTQYTTETVDINVVYGVAARNIYELYVASEDQKEYAFQEGNLINAKELNDPHNFYNTEIDCFNQSKSVYSVVMEADCIYPTDINDKFYLESEKAKEERLANENPWEYNPYEKCPDFFGNVYGNNHMITADRSKFTDRYFAITRISWSNITMSNVVLRCCNLPDSGEIISGDETTELLGKCIYIHGHDEYYNRRFRLRNVTIEYSIMENGYQLSSVSNTDLKLDGIVIRNNCSVGMYVPYWNGGEYGTDSWEIEYSRIECHNYSCTNALGSAFSIGQEQFGQTATGGGYKFGKTYEENMKFMKEHFFDKGFVTYFHQTGFMNIYNWQSTSDAKLIQTGERKFDDILAMVTEDLLGKNKALENFRYKYKGVDYINLGFILTGINMGDSLVCEPIYGIVICDDPRMDSFDVSQLDESGDSFIVDVIKGLELTLTIYGYNNKSDIKPGQTLSLTSKYIQSMHS